MTSSVVVVSIAAMTISRAKVDEMRVKSMENDLGDDGFWTIKAPPALQRGPWGGPNAGSFGRYGDGCGRLCARN
jgi:hypothetical protein